MAFFGNQVGGNDSSQPKPRERYKRIQCLGRGSFGMVWLYKDNQTNSLVAIKELYTGGDGFDEVKKEITNLEKMKSPYIVRLINHFDDPSAKMYRLVMEYCSGGSLKGKLFGDDELLIVAKHILNGLHYMHSRGFIHRDIKPDNLLCHKEKNKTVYKLGDLGSSKNMEHSVKTYTGTVSFMAPEVLKLKGIKPKSGRHYNNKADIWSFGATILCLGEGSLCKIECNPKFKKIEDEKLKKLIKICLIMDPKKRPPVDTLRKYLQSENENDCLDNFVSDLTTVLESEPLETLARAFESDTNDQTFSNLFKNDDDVKINMEFLEKMFDSNELSRWVHENKIKESIDITMKYWRLLKISKNIIKIAKDKIDTSFDCYTTQNVMNQAQSICNEYRKLIQHEPKLKAIKNEWGRIYQEQLHEACFWMRKVTEIMPYYHDMVSKLDKEIQQNQEAFWWSQWNKKQKIIDLESRRNHYTQSIMAIKQTKDAFKDMSQDSRKMDILFNDFAAQMNLLKQRIAKIDVQFKKLRSLRLLQMYVKRVSSDFAEQQKLCIDILKVIEKAQLRFNSE